MTQRIPQPATNVGTPEETQPQSAASNLFDLRVMIGGLFVLYGLILIVAGALASGAELRKASGIDINLWMGIGMFILGALFLFWWRARPLRVQPAPESEQPELPPKLQRETVSRGQDTAAHPARRSEVSSVAPRQNGDDSAI